MPGKSVLLAVLFVLYGVTVLKSADSGTVKRETRWPGFDRAMEFMNASNWKTPNFNQAIESMNNWSNDLRIRSIKLKDSLSSGINKVLQSYFYRQDSRTAKRGPTPVLSSVPATAATRSPPVPVLPPAPTTTRSPPEPPVPALRPAPATTRSPPVPVLSPPSTVTVTTVVPIIAPHSARAAPQDSTPSPDLVYQPQELYGTIINVVLIAAVAFLSIFTIVVGCVCRAKYKFKIVEARQRQLAMHLAEIRAPMPPRQTNPPVSVSLSNRAQDQDQEEPPPSYAETFQKGQQQQLPRV